MANVATTGDGFRTGPFAEDEVIEGYDLHLTDDDYVRFGSLDSTGDAYIGWDGTNLVLLPGGADTGSFNIGDGSTDMDVKIFLGGTTEYVLFDVGNSRVDYGADDKGVDVRFFSEEANHLVWFDQNADTNQGTWYFGANDHGVDVYLYGETSGNSVQWDQSAQEMIFTHTEASQTTERNVIDISETQDSTYITGTNMTYSGARGSAVIKIDSTCTMASGGFSNIYSNISTSGAFSTDGNGIVGVKAVVTNTAALTDGEIYGAQFIAKHNSSSNSMLANASLIGIEAWTYNSAAGTAVTQLGANLGFHNEASSGTYGAGSVIRGIQIFCDNASGADTPVESTGLCIWNQAGTITNAINVVESGNGFTNLIQVTDGGVCAKSSQTNGGSQEGWMKVLVGSATRYIRLWSTGPS